MRVAHLAALAEKTDGELRRRHRIAQLMPQPREPIAVAAASIHLAFERLAYQDLHGCVRQRGGQPLLLLRGERRVVLEHGVVEKVRQQAPLHRRTPPARGRSGHAGARQTETLLQRVARGIEELRQ